MNIDLEREREIASRKVEFVSPSQINMLKKN